MDESPWLWPDWHPDRSGIAKKVEIPEAGGWMYQFRAGDGVWTNVFVPNLAAWADAIAAVVAKGGKAAVSLDLDLDHVSHTKQARPGSKG